MNDARAEKIRQALGRLDTEDDMHWTAQGLPNLRAVTEIATGKPYDGDNRVRRSEVRKVDEHLTRDVARQRAKSKLDELLGDTGPDTLPGPDARPTPPEPPAAPAPSTVVLTHETVLTHPPLEIVADRGLLEQAVRLLTENEIELERRRAALQARRDLNSRLLETFGRALEAGRAADEKIDWAKRVREQDFERKLGDAERVASLRRNGVDLESAVKALDPRSPIDRAFAARKPGRGSVRPKVPLAHTG